MVSELLNHAPAESKPVKWSSIFVYSSFIFEVKFTHIEVYSVKWIIWWVLANRYAFISHTPIKTFKKKKVCHLKNFPWALFWSVPNPRNNHNFYSFHYKLLFSFFFECHVNIYHIHFCILLLLLSIMWDLSMFFNISVVLSLLLLRSIPLCNHGKCFINFLSIVGLFLL